MPRQWQCSIMTRWNSFQPRFNELRDNLEHLRRTQVDNKGASTTLVKNNIASFMEAVDIMKGLLDSTHVSPPPKLKCRYSTFIGWWSKEECLCTRAQLGRRFVWRCTERPIVTAGSTLDISRNAHAMYDTDLARKDYSDTIRNALNVIQRYKFIFHLPQTIERSVKRVWTLEGRDI